MQPSTRGAVIGMDRDEEKASLFADSQAITMGVAAIPLNADAVALV